MAKAMNMSVVIVLFDCELIVHVPKSLKFIVIARRKIMEAIAWVIKYLVAASVDRGLFLLDMRGIIASKFISRPIHIRK